MEKKWQGAGGGSNWNPIIKMDFPDPDVIRVDDTYYMASTTMHFFPGCALLRSYDLVNWEMAGYVFDHLDHTKGQCLVEEEDIYGQGMWAPSLRFHKGIFYLCFVANDTHKTYLYTAKAVEGPWERQKMEGFYHDCSLFFDEDDRVYLVYGNTEIHLTQLKPDLSGMLPGGIDRVIVTDKDNHFLGYEGSHMYRINGRYYLFLIHSDRDRWLRTESCFTAEDLNGEFTGGDVLQDTRGYCGQGVAQGGIVDTPWGDWYAVLFQDHGAVGRIPVLLPVHFEDHFPVFGERGQIPEKFAVRSTRPDYRYEPLYGSDDFDYVPDKEGHIHLKMMWQFNHVPNNLLWGVEEQCFWIQSGKLCQNLEHAVNTLTQRLLFPACRITVTVDTSSLKDGDYAGLCALQGCYGMIAVKLEGEARYLVMGAREGEDDSLQPMPKECGACREFEKIPLREEQVTLYLETDFWQMRDRVRFGYVDQGKRVALGPVHKLYFKLDHFCGCRAGLFLFSTKQPGGKVRFSQFQYNKINQEN